MLCTLLARRLFSKLCATPKARASDTGSELAKKLAAVEFDKIDLHVHFPDGATPKARASRGA